MKNFKEKWFISASSGVLGKIILALVLLGGGCVGAVYLLPEESKITQTIAGILPAIIGCLLGYLPRFFEFLKDWSHQESSDRIRTLELKNENLKLELELQREKRKSLPEDEE